MRSSKIIKEIYSNIQILNSNVYYSKNNNFELISMNDILKKSNKLSIEINKRLKNEDDRVIGIILDISLEYLISIFATLKSKCVFVPLSHKWNDNYIEKIIKDANIKLIITITSGYTKNKLNLNKINLDEINLNENNNEIIKYEDNKEHVTMMSYCYIMYTSGTTTTTTGSMSMSMKGVKGTEEGILNRCKWMHEYYPPNLCNNDFRIAFSTSPVFVDSIFQIFYPFLYNISMVILNKEIITYPKLFWSTIKQLRITHFISIPSLLRILFNNQEKDNSSKNELKLLISSGEILSNSVARDIIYQLSEECKFINLYGCTEVAADSTYYEINKNYFRNKINVYDNIPIGYPISNTCIILLSNNSIIENFNNNEPVSIGDTGTIWLSSIGICENYIKECNNDNFKYINSKIIKKWLNDNNKSILCNFKDEICERDIKFFYTGDIGVINKNTKYLEYIGRIDSIIKYNGQKLDLNKIKNILINHTIIEDVEIKLWNNYNEISDVHQRSILIIYVKINNKSMPKLYIMEELNQYIKLNINLDINFKFEIIENFEKSDSGKILKDKLPLPHNITSNDNKKNEIISEINIKNTFEEILSIKLEAIDDVFDFGCDSLSVVEIADHLSIEPYLIYEYPTVRKLTNYLKSKKRKTRDINKNNKIIYKLENKDKNTWTIEENTIDMEKLSNRNMINLFIDNDKRSVIKERNITIEINSDIKNVDKINDLIEKWNSGEFESYTIYVRNESYTIYVRNEVYKMYIRNENKIKNNNWCKKLDSCIDTSPVLITFRNKEKEIEWHNTIIIIISHQGEICCLEACKGHLIWQRHLNKIIKYSCVITKDLKYIVVVYENRIIIINMKNGEYIKDIKLNQEIKSDPVLDPWLHLIWTSTENGFIFITDTNSILFKYKVDKKSISSPLTFHHEKSLVIGTTLSGKIFALRCKYNVNIEYFINSIYLLWIYDSDASIFSKPCIKDELIIFGNVNGIFTILNTKGNLINRLDIGNIIYAPISIIYSKIAVISTFNGYIHFYDIKGHNLIACLDLKLCGNLSNAIILHNYHFYIDDGKLVVISNDGVMMMFKLNLNDKSLLLSLCDVCKLPGESFSGAFFIENTIIVGCRNNCLFNINF